MIASTSIDWRQPWYASVRDAAHEIIGRSDWLAALNRQSEALQLINHRGLPLRFVEQTNLPEGVAYESFISATGTVPTRDNLHDFFNALVWLSFPNVKRALNALQAAQIARAGIGSTRGAARDAATLFDENAALLVVSDIGQGRTLVDALRRHEWHEAFVEQRATFGQHAEIWLFGHALMEKLVTPYKSITAHAWVVYMPEQYFSKPVDVRCKLLDEQVADVLNACAAEGLNTGNFTPLPVMGIPGWWPLQNAKFYADTAVFRTKRT